MATNDGSGNIAKWGFGMAPLKQTTLTRYCDATRDVERFLAGELAAADISLESISEVKGLVNRCIQQDQWDWFTVFEMFGEPDLRDLYRASAALQHLRLALKEKDATNIGVQKGALSNSYFLTHCRNFLGDSVRINLEPGEGYVYILSTREQADVLKIGMTTRPVSARVKEINAATGLLVPFGARGAFKVRNARDAERKIFGKLIEYRIRVDREFFRINFFKAVSVIKSYLKEEDLLSARSGQIKWFSAEKCYGFIAAGDEGDLFFHISEVEALERNKLEAGTEVSFQIGYHPKGKCARTVRIAE